MPAAADDGHSRRDQGIGQGRGRPRRGTALYPAREYRFADLDNDPPVPHRVSDQVRNRLGNGVTVAQQTLTLFV